MTNILILVFPKCTNRQTHEYYDELITMDTLDLTWIERFSSDIGRPSCSIDKLETHV